MYSRRRMRTAYSGACSPVVYGDRVLSSRGSGCVVRSLSFSLGPASPCGARQASALPSRGALNKHGLIRSLPAQLWGCRYCLREFARANLGTCRRRALCQAPCCYSERRADLILAALPKTDMISRQAYEVVCATLSLVSGASPDSVVPPSGIHTFALRPRPREVDGYTQAATLLQSLQSALGQAMAMRPSVGSSLGARR